jgi:hypothetical protein
MFKPTSDPSRHESEFVPYPFRPFWHPNSSALPTTHEDTKELDRLSQKLDFAEKKIIEYAQLSEFFTFRQTSLVYH